MPTIKGSKFILREVNLEKDKRDIIEGINKPEIMGKLSLDYPYTEEHWKWFENDHKEIREGKNSNCSFIIDVDGKAVGNITIMIDGKASGKHVGKLGYWLAIEQWGRGIMSEAVGLVCDYALNDLGLKRLEIGFLAENRGSARVAEKNGFKFEYRERKATLKEGGYQDLITTVKFAEGF